MSELTSLPMATSCEYCVFANYAMSFVPPTPQVGCHLGRLDAYFADGVVENVRSDDGDRQYCVI